MPKIKKCPFCKGEASILPPNYPEGRYAWEVGCDNIGCLVLPSATGVTKEMAIEWWNDRSPKGGESR